MRVVSWGLGFVFTLACGVMAFTWLTTFHPDAVQEEPIICSPEAPMLKAGQKVKVLNWNVQFMAGKDYVFWYDLLDGSGPDTEPTATAVAKTLDEVVRVIQEEDPDIIMLQELDDGAKRTSYEDQLLRLLQKLPDEYKCHSSAFYWKATFVPHPKILGSVGMKLTTISKYRISKAKRYQLALIPKDPITRQFHLKRAALEVHLPMEGANILAVVNTHLSAFAQGTDTVRKQVQTLHGIVSHIAADETPWILGGDFNSLPSGEAYDRLNPPQQAYYNKETELAPLFEAYKSVPSLKETAKKPEKWFTHFPNDPAVTAPDRTIDFLFFDSNVKLGKHQVLHKNTHHISDHLPVIATFTLP
jgi:endonuclease/exonuclease/phosphatase family metal-dependent hydrolase